LEKYIQEFKSYLIAEKNASPHTVSSYLIDLYQFVQFLRETGHGEAQDTLHPKNIDRLAIRSFLAYLYENSAGGATMARKLSTLSSFFRFLCREGIVETNVAKTVPSPKKENKLPSYLSVDEIFRLLDLPDRKSFAGSRDGAILELFYSTGVRISELTGIRMQDLHLHERMVKVRGKGKKERLLPVGQKSADALGNYIKFRDKRIARFLSGPEELFLARGQKDSGKIYQAQQFYRKNFSPFTQAFIRHPHAGRRSGFTIHTGNAGAFELVNNSKIHTSHDRSSDGSVRQSTSQSAGVKIRSRAVNS